MDSWHNVNYQTYNRTLRVQLMNSSTQDWNVGHLPPHVFVQPNDTSRLPDDALILRKAGKTSIGGSPIEQVVFGIIAGVVIAWGLGWAVWTWRNTRFFIPRSSVPDDEGVLTAAEFKQTLNTRYYDGIDTRLEIFDTDDEAHREHQQGPAKGGAVITAQDVEAVTALMRRMYQIKLSIWDLKDSPNVEDERKRLKDQSESAWAEIQRKVGQLKLAEGSLKGERPEETRGMRNHLDQIVTTVEGIPN